MKKFKLHCLSCLSLLFFSQLVFSLTENQQLSNGKKLYEARCIMCHGTDANGDGPLAQKSNPPTPDLTSCRYRKKLAEGAVVSSVVLTPNGALIPNTLKENGINMPNKIWTSTELANLNNYVLSLTSLKNICLSQGLDDQKNSHDFFGGKLTDWLMIGFNAILAAATIWLGCSTKKLWIAAKKQSKDTERALEISRQSAEAAIKNANIAEESSKKQLRAYISATPGKIFCRSGLQRFIISVANTGLTPAHDIHISYNIGIYPLNTPDPSLFTDLKQAGSEVAIQPRQNFNANIFLQPSLHLEDVEKIATQTNSIYLYIKINYKDSFDENRITELCVFTNGPSIRLATNSHNQETAVEWEFEKHHNSSK